MSQCKWATTQILTCLIGRVAGLPKKKDVDEPCLLKGLRAGRWGTSGGGTLSAGVVAKPKILRSSVVGEKPAPAKGCFIVGKTPPLPSGTPLSSLSPAAQVTGLKHQV